MSIELSSLIDSTLFKSTTTGLSGTGKLVYSGSTLSWEQDPVVPSIGYAYLDSNSSTDFSLTSGDLTDPADYVDMTGTSMWSQKAIKNCTTNSTLGTITVTYAGVYEVAFWANIQSDVLNTSFGIKYDVNGTKSPTSIVATSKDTTDTHNMSAKGIVTLGAGDTIKITLAADTTCTATVKSAGFSLNKIDNV